MSLAQAMCTSFKRQILVGLHNMRPTANGGDTFKIALYTNATGTYDANTTAYSTTSEASGTGYTAGGNSLTGNNVSSADLNATGFATFANTTWSASTITARGAVIYNSTGLGRRSGTNLANSTDNDWISGANATSNNAAVCVLDFGSDKTTTAGDFTINFPTFGATTAIIRIA